VSQSQPAFRMRGSGVIVAAAVGLGLHAAPAVAQTVCEPTHTISAIQGNTSTQAPGGAHGDVSPLNGQVVTLQGVVVADYQSIPQATRSGELRGFFLQEETADQDADPSTSEGLFVFTGSAPSLDVQEGQTVCVSGPVSEFFGMTQVTAALAGSLALVGEGSALPPAATLDLPVVGDINDYYEQFEGMRVRFADTLYVSEYFEVARYGQIVLTAGSRPYQYTHGDTTPTAAEYSTFLGSLARRRIILDDTDNTQNSPLPAGAFFHPQPGGLSIGFQGKNYFRGGDAVRNLTGVLHWSFAGQSGTDAWRVRPTKATPVTFSVRNARPSRPPPRLGGTRVATFNVLNYFNTLDTTSSTNTGPCGPSGTLDCRGADSLDELNRQSEKLVAALKAINADVFGLVEIENNGGAAIPAIAELTARLNAVVDGAPYRYVDTGVVGTDAITVGILYKSTAVKPKGAPAILSDNAFVDPNSTGLQRNRPAIAQTFEAIGRPGFERGQAFTVVVNHLKSKGADGAVGADADQLDGQSAWSDTRTRAASYLANVWIPSDPTGQGDSDFVIVGDLNAYRGEAPVTTLRNAGFRDLHQTFEGLEGYSYVFDGQLGYLDHALANSSMASQAACLATWPINSDEVPVFDYNDTVRDAGESAFEAEPTANPLYEANPARTSDHDPIVVDFNLCPDRGAGQKQCALANAIARIACSALNHLPNQ
jgi:predicted extracellular nuclease